jgi:hypothetical protein
MPRPLSQTQRNIAYTLLSQNTAYKDIAEQVNCSIPQVKKMSRNMKAWNSVVAPKLGHQGRPLIFTKEMEEVLISRLSIFIFSRTNFFLGINELSLRRPMGIFGGDG